MDRLSHYPFVVVRIACGHCRRGGAYRLARLAEKHGAEIALDVLLYRLAADCPYQPDPAGKSPRKYGVKCGAHFPDITGAPRPPDLPGAMLRLRVVGGRDTDP